MPEGMTQYFLSTGKKELSTRILYPVKIFFWNGRKIKASSYNWKLRDFVARLHVKKKNSLKRNEAKNEENMWKEEERKGSAKISANTL